MINSKLIMGLQSSLIHRAGFYVKRIHICGEIAKCCTTLLPARNQAYGRRVFRSCCTISKRSVVLTMKDVETEMVDREA
jgi:hypothetical protein